MQDAISIEIYETDSGKRPFEDWVKNLDSPIRGVIWARMARMRLGNIGDFKAIKGSDIYELRLQCGPGYRIYFGKQGRYLVLLLCGGDKGSQDRDIKKASKYWQDYQSRGSEDTSHGKK